MSSSFGDAVAACLQTTELLEMILQHVDSKTLLQAQRTCKTLMEVINGSPKLQRKLFAAPATLDRAILVQDDHGTLDAPFLALDTDDQVALHRNFRLSQVALLNPFLVRQPCPTHGLQTLETLRIGHNNVNSMAYPSLLKMYPMHPMPQTLRLRIQLGQRREGGGGGDADVLLLPPRTVVNVLAPGYDSDGPLTIGQIVDWAERHVMKLHGCDVRWNDAVVYQYGRRLSVEEVRTQIARERGVAQ